MENPVYILTYRVNRNVGIYFLSHRDGIPSVYALHTYACALVCWQERWSAFWVSVPNVWWLSHKDHRNVALCDTVMYIPLLRQWFLTRYSRNAGLTRCSNRQLYPRSWMPNRMKVVVWPCTVNIYSPVLAAVSGRWANRADSVFYRGVTSHMIKYFVYFVGR